MKRKHYLRWLLIVPPVLLTACVGPQQLGIPSDDWQQYDDSKRQKLQTNYEKVQKLQKTITKQYSGPIISATLFDGKVMMPPEETLISFQKVSFTLLPGSCQSVLLQNVAIESKVTMRACYDGRTLFVDPSPADVNQPFGSVRFTYTPVWKRGLTYTGIDSSGYVKLHHVNITIQATANDADDSST